MGGVDRLTALNAAIEVCKANETTDADTIVAVAEKFHSFLTK